MGLKFRKSVKIAPGVKLNFSKRGVSTTVGKRGMSVTHSSRGTTANAGIPGTGISYSTRIGGKSHPSRRTSGSPAAASGSKTAALILCILLGWLGVHYFYVGRVGMGILYLLTMGLFGIGWIVDIIRIAINKFPGI